MRIVPDVVSMLWLAKDEPAANGEGPKLKGLDGSSNDNKFVSDYESSSDSRS